MVPCSLYLAPKRLEYMFKQERNTMRKLNRTHALAETGPICRFSQGIAETSKHILCECLSRRRFLTISEEKPMTRSYSWELLNSIICLLEKTRFYRLKRTSTIDLKKIEVGKVHI